MDFDKDEAILIASLPELDDYSPFDDPEYHDLRERVRQKGSPLWKIQLLQEGNGTLKYADRRSCLMAFVCANAQIRILERGWYSILNRDRCDGRPEPTSSTPDLVPTESGGNVGNVAEPTPIEEVELEHELISRSNEAVLGSERPTGPTSPDCGSGGDEMDEDSAGAPEGVAPATLPDFPLLVADANIEPQRDGTMGGRPAGAPEGISPATLPDQPLLMANASIEPPADGTRDGCPSGSASAGQPTEGIDVLEPIQGAGCQNGTTADQPIRVVEIRLSDIKIGDRFRKDPGNIESLATSIEEQGLLQPIAVDENNRLLFGHRRLMAFERLSRATIPARVIHADSPLPVEFAENEFRKDLNKSEKANILESMKASFGSRQGKRDVEPVANRPQVPKGQKTRDYASQKAGFPSTTSARRVQKVMKLGSPDLKDAVDRGLIRVGAAEVLLGLSWDEQRAVLAQGLEAIKRTVRDLRNAGKHRHSLTVDESDRQDTVSDGGPGPESPMGPSNATDGLGTDVLPVGRTIPMGGDQPQWAEAEPEESAGPPAQELPVAIDDLSVDQLVEAITRRPLEQVRAVAEGCLRKANTNFVVCNLSDPVADLEKIVALLTTTYPAALVRDRARAEALMSDHLSELQPDGRVDGESGEIQTYRISETSAAA